MAQINASIFGLILPSYPNIAWDTLYHAGASQIHPHIHMMMAPDHYYGYFELMRSAAQRYYQEKGENYFNAVLEVHAALGLVVEYGDAVAIPTMVSSALCMHWYLCLWLCTGYSLSLGVCIWVCVYVSFDIHDYVHVGVCV